jgi:GH43 family beta-xylosidase
MVVGGFLIVHSLAVGLSMSAEAENGARSGNAAVCSDAQAAQASNAQTVQFGHPACAAPLPQYNTPAMGTEPGGNIIWYNGYYYTAVKLGSEPRVRMMKAKYIKDFAVLKDESALLAQPVIWDAAGSPISGYINWPVAIYHLRGKWYMYVNAAKNNPPNFTDRLWALESNTDDPMGGWTLKGQVGQDTWTIGFCAFEWNNQLYMIVSNREGHTAGTHHALAIASMSNPWTTTSNWTTLTDPDYDWEKYSIDGPGTAPINEVDQPVVHNGKLHVFYSASHVNSPNYAAGVLTYNGSGNLLDRNNWTKRSTPILSRTSQISGPGQTFVLKSPDGTKDYLGYAYWNTPTQLSPRHLGLIPIGWDANNNPTLSPPPNPGTLLNEPPQP